MVPLRGSVWDTSLKPGANEAGQSCPDIPLEPGRRKTVETVGRLRGLRGHPVKAGANEIGGRAVRFHPSNYPLRVRCHGLAPILFSVIS